MTLDCLTDSHRPVFFLHFKGSTRVIGLIGTDCLSCFNGDTAPEVFEMINDIKSVRPGVLGLDEGPPTPNMCSYQSNATYWEDTCI